MSSTCPTRVRQYDRDRIRLWLTNSATLRGAGWAGCGHRHGNEPLQGDWLRCGPPNGFPTLFSTEARHVGEARQDEAAQRVDNEPRAAINDRTSGAH
jgi:hypothetical protein